MSISPVTSPKKPDAHHLSDERRESASDSELDYQNDRLARPCEVHEKFTLDDIANIEDSFLMSVLAHQECSPESSPPPIIRQHQLYVKFVEQRKRRLSPVNGVSMAKISPRSIRKGYAAPVQRSLSAHESDHT